MKLPLILSTLLLPLIMIAQIDNGGFEIWTESLPQVVTEWESNRTEDFLRYDIIDEGEASRGVHALKLIPSSPSAWTDCTSVISQRRALDEPIQAGHSLFWDMKAIPLDTSENLVAFIMRLNIFFEGELIDGLAYEQSEPLYDWTEVEVALPGKIDSFELSFAGAALNGAADGCHNLSEIWLDEVRFSESSSTSTKGPSAKSANLIYPNPSTGIINVSKLQGLYDRVEVLDVTGRVIATETLPGDHLTILDKGMFLLRFRDSQSQAESIHRIVVH